MKMYSFLAGVPYKDFVANHLHLCIPFPRMMFFAFFFYQNNKPDCPLCISKIRPGTFMAQDSQHKILLSNTQQIQ